VSYDQVAEFIAGDQDTHDYFLDTNFFTDHQVKQTVWDALGQKRITMTTGVWKELLPWRSNPFYNGHMVPVFNDAKEAVSSTILFDEDAAWGVPCGVFRNWYVNVLAERKRRAQSFVDEFVANQGRQPSSEELNTLFQKAGNERDFHIFRKGQREISVGANVFTDEELVATAAMVTLAAGRNTTILTRDHDVLEQFYKLTGLLTIHYQATLFAERWTEGPSRFQSQPMPSSKELCHYFVVDQSVIIRKPVAPDAFFTWLLPRNAEPLRMRCVLFTGQNDGLAMTPLTYICETPMLKLVEAKGQSWGLNTELLNGKNCHVTGFPVGISDPRSFVVLALDRFVRDSNSQYKFPRLDLAHATTHFEELKSV